MGDEMASVNDTVCDDTPSMRTAFISVGTCLSAMGCVFNAVLFYIFITKTKRTYPFQTFLAFLDFMLCALYIHCFGFLAMAVEWKIPFLYNMVMDTNVTSLVMSRIVQLTIPYTLIANSADKLAMISGKDLEKRSFFHLRLLVIVVLIVTATLLRCNGFLLLSVSTDENCDFFNSKWLSQRQLPPDEAEMWATFENVLTFFHTFVSFVILCALNIIVVLKLRVEHRRARRQSTSPSQLFSTSIARLNAAQEIREQQHRLRCAVKTTVVIISAYLACNCLNFILYIMETFERSWIIEPNGSFRPFYVVISDLGSSLFVLSSAIRIFIYYKYNSDIRILKLDADLVPMSKNQNQNESKTAIVNKMLEVEQTFWIVGHRKTANFEQLNILIIVVFLLMVGFILIQINYLYRRLKKNIRSDECTIEISADVTEDLENSERFKENDEL